MQSFFLTLILLLSVRVSLATVPDGTHFVLQSQNFSSQVSEIEWAEINGLGTQSTTLAFATAPLSLEFRKLAIIPGSGSNAQPLLYGLNDRGELYSLSPHQLAPMLIRNGISAIAKKDDSTIVEVYRKTNDIFVRDIFGNTIDLVMGWLDPNKFGPIKKIQINSAREEFVALTEGFLLIGQYDLANSKRSKHLTVIDLSIIQMQSYRPAGPFDLLSTLDMVANSDSSVWVGALVQDPAKNYARRLVLVHFDRQAQTFSQIVYPTTHAIELLDVGMHSGNLIYRDGAHYMSAETLSGATHTEQAGMFSSTKFSQLNLVNAFSGGLIIEHPKSAHTSPAKIAQIPQLQQTPIASFSSLGFDPAVKKDFLTRLKKELSLLKEPFTAKEFADAVGTTYALKYDVRDIDRAALAKIGFAPQVDQVAALNEKSRDPHTFEEIAEVYARDQLTKCASKLVKP